jgi:hypothetical protein
MGLRDLFKKAVVLSLVFVVFLVIYTLKNNGSLPGYLEKAKASESISLSDINVDKLINKANGEEKIGQNVEEKKEVVAVVVEESAIISLREIKDKVDKISVQVEELRKEVDNLIVLDGLQKQVENITKEVNRIANSLNTYGQGVYH